MRAFNFSMNLDLFFRVLIPTNLTKVIINHRLCECFETLSQKRILFGCETTCRFQFMVFVQTTRSHRHGVCCLIEKTFL